jgi:hypothetical protein
MTPFAMFFMFTSMISVTLLAGWCLYRILNTPPRSDDGN